MTDTERLARLEARTDEQERRLERIEEKVDSLLELAAVGKGAGWLFDQSRRRPGCSGSRRGLACGKVGG